MKSLITGARALALGCALALAVIAGGCNTTGTDRAVSSASGRLAAYCGSLRFIALGAVVGSPEKQQAAWAKASAIVNTVCANPPADTAGAIRVAAETLAAIERMR
jgi:hypothetical protein